jgi:tetratricopeptide (TPR) repeat protein
MFCHQCGKPLTLGIEKYCPFCGTNLLQQREGQPLPVRDTHSIGIHTKGDVFGIGTSGSGNIIAQEANIQGGVINLINPSKEAVEVLVGIKRAKTQLDITSKEDIEDEHKVIEKTQEVMAEKQQVSQVLEEIDKIGKERGVQIQEIRAENIEISRKELLLKEYILKGNEHYYKRRYRNALEFYDKATNIDPNNTDILFNKAYTLTKLGRHSKAIEYYSRLLKANPKNSVALNNMAYELAKMGLNDEALPMVEKSLSINPNSGYTWDTKGFILFKKGRYDEAIKSYDEAIRKDQTIAVRWRHKGDALLKVGRDVEAEECYQKAKELK